MKKSLISITLLFITASTFAQSAIPFKVKLPLYGLKLDSLSFTLEKAIDQREDKEKFASVLEGPLNLNREYRMNGGFQHTFEKRIFHPIMRNVECGNPKVALALKQFFIEEKKEDIGVKNGRKRNYRIEVDYYLIEGNQMKFLYTDQMKFDSTISPAKYYFNDFVYDFFEYSIPKLDQYIKENNVALSQEKDLASSLISDSLNEDNNQIKDYNTKKLTNVNELPKEESRSLEEHLIGIERFMGEKAHGLSFRYQYFSRKWDTLSWIPSLAIEIEAIELYENFDDDPNIYDIYYSYFGIGISTLKPLNNYLFVNLSAQIVFGRESIDHSFFTERTTNNFLFGVLLDQRLMLLLGKGFGVYFTGGVFQNFMPTTEYLPFDYGLSFGGGLKF